MTIKALCMTEDPDRPTSATFVGLVEAGVDVTVVCPASAPARADLLRAGARVVDLERRGRLDVAGVRRLRREIARERYDIVHAFSGRTLQSALLAARGLPVRIVAYRGIVGNVSFFDPASWMRFLNPRIDRIVCVAEAVRAYFLAMRPAFLRVPEKKLVTIHKGHDLDWYSAPPADLRDVGVPAGAFVVVCVANYRPRKGIERLVEAVGRLPESLQAHLLLVGDMASPRLSRAIAASPAADRIHRVGHRADAPALTAACDVFVMPSTRREGLSRSLIEAMAYAVAPVVTDCGGNTELVVDEASGLVVPVNDADAIARAVERLHDDPALRERLGAAARERIRTQFPVERTIEQTLALYRELVGC